MPTDWGLVAKALLLAVLAVQAARLIWVLVQPVGPVGDWRPVVPRPLALAARTALIASVDPFDRSATVTAAAMPDDLKLFGVRDNVSSVGGGAIIGLPDGQQVSVSVGEEITPGVSLFAVGFDYVEIQRQGGRQRLFLDQDKAPEAVNGATPAPASAPSETVATSGTVTVDQLRAGTSFQPRQNNGAVNGIIVQPGADTAAFNAAGFRSGDVIVMVNGVRIQSATDAAQLQQSLVPGASLSLTVERGGQPTPLTIRISGKQ